MPDEFKSSVEAYFSDPRPVFDVKYDVETRVKRLLPRDPEQPDALVFRASEKSATTEGTNTIELRLEAAFDSDNLYALLLDYEGPCTPANQKTWSENMRRTMGRWTEGFTRSEPRPGGSPERFRQLVEGSAERQPDDEDPAAILTMQQSILTRLREGKRFFTADHEGGTHIKWIGDRFVFQDYGESDDREEFTAEAPFLERLRKFYDWKARYSWMPHTPPETEVWRIIDHELK
jgi:hypothetical protein